MEFRTLDDLMNMAKLLPEEGKRDFMAVMLGIEEEEITTLEAVDLIAEIFDRHQLKQ